MTYIQALAQEAEDAFWEVLRRHFPQATTGNLSIDRTIRLTVAAEAAIEEWIANNVTTQHCDIAVGYRFKLFREVDRFPEFLAPTDLTGVVTTVNDSGVCGRMDQHIAGAEQWDNQIHWQTPDEFAGDTVPI
jgi:hypothetical protein